MDPSFFQLWLVVHKSTLIKKLINLISAIGFLTYKFPWVLARWYLNHLPSCIYTRSKILNKVRRRIGWRHRILYSKKKMLWWKLKLTIFTVNTFVMWCIQRRRRRKPNLRCIIDNFSANNFSLSSSFSSKLSQIIVNKFLYFKSLQDIYVPVFLVDDVIKRRSSSSWNSLEMNDASLQNPVRIHI